MGERGLHARPVRRKAKAFSYTDIPAVQPWEAEGLSRSEKVVLFLETLPISSGMLSGENFTVQDWQREQIIEPIYATDEVGRRRVREAFISIPRKNGKTGLIAGISLCHLCGPEAVGRGQIISVAGDIEQSSLVFDEMCAVIERTPWMARRIIIRSFTKQLEDVETGTKYKALSSESKTKFGKSPSLWIYDELAQAPDNKLYVAISTATGAWLEPLGIVISTQAADPNHIMSVLYDDAEQLQKGLVKDDSKHSCIYSAPPEADIWDEETWKSCNPALDTFRSREEMQSFARKAQRMPSLEPMFRLLYLNQRVQIESSVVARAEWVACKQQGEQLKEGEEVFLGLDLSMVRDLSALVACSANDGDRLKAWFWKPGDELAEHIRRDKVPYDLWVKDGWIEAPKGETVDYQYLVLRLAQICQDYKVLGLAYDRWNIKNLQKEMDAIGLRYWRDGKDKPVPGVLRLVEWAQSYSDMSPAISALENSVLSRKLKHDGNPVLTFCIANAIATMDAAGNRKLDKSATRYRIDGAVAAAMAIGLKAKQPAKKVPEYQFFAV